MVNMMKQFLYLDTDIVTSIIAQAEKGYITQKTEEVAEDNNEQRGKSLEVEAHAKTNGGFLGFFQGEFGASAKGALNNLEAVQTSSRDVAEKILHDAAYDIAVKYIEPHITTIGDDSSVEEGSYIEIIRVFNYIDFDYLESLFSTDGLIDYLKAENEKDIEANFRNVTASLSREQRRNKQNEIKKEMQKQKKESAKEFDGTEKLIKVFKKLLPYNRLLLSSDGYLIPLDDKYFRIDPSNLGFKYGGEMTCVGMVTNIIGSSTDPCDDNNMFATIQFSVNEALRSILPTKEEDLYVIHPIAVYYGK